MRAASYAAAVAIIALAGCGGSGGATTTHPEIHLTQFEKHGKAIFIPTCGPCHTLADAGTSGTAGPALAEPLSAAYVLGVIVHGKGAMTPGLSTGRDAAAIAAYVAAATK